jgi:hypothetical protein
MTTASMIYTDDLVYEHIDEGLSALPGLVEWLFSHITETTGAEKKPPEMGWDKLITAGLRSGVSQRWYTESFEFVPGAHALNFEGGLFVSFLLNSLLSLQAECNFTMDTLVYRGIDNIGGGGGYTPVFGNARYTSYSLMFPLILKVNFKPRGFHLAPFGGVYAFLPLGNTRYQRNPGGEQRTLSWSAAAPLGYTLGLEGSRRLGPGLLIADIRYTGDFSAITLHNAKNTATSTENMSYGRNGLSVTLGYAFGFIDTNRR